MSRIAPAIEIANLAFEALDSGNGHVIRSILQEMKETYYYHAKEFRTMYSQRTVAQTDINVMNSMLTEMIGHIEAVQQHLKNIIGRTTMRLPTQYPFAHGRR